MNRTFSRFISPAAGRFTGALPPCGLAVIALLALDRPAMTDALQFDRSAVLAGQWWRLLTGNLVHFGADHALWDVAVLMGLGIACGLRDARRTAWTLAISMIAVTSAVLLIQPGIQIYRGLSGIDCALFGLAATSTAGRAIRQHHRAAMVITLTALGGFFMKTAYELCTSQTVFVDSQQAGFAPVPLAHLVGALCGVWVALTPRLTVPAVRRLAVPVTMLILMCLQSGCLTSAMWRRGVKTTVQNPQVVSGKANGAVLIQYGEGNDTTRVVLPIERSADAVGPLRYTGAGRSLAAIEQDVSADQASAVNRCVLPLDWPAGSRYIPPAMKTGSGGGGGGAPSAVLDVEVFAFDPDGKPVGDIVRLGSGQVSARFPSDSAIYLLPRTQPRAAGAIAGDTFLLLVSTPLALAIDLVITPLHWMSGSPLD